VCDDLPDSAKAYCTSESVSLLYWAERTHQTGWALDMLLCILQCPWFVVARVAPNGHVIKLLKRVFICSVAVYSVGLSTGGCLFKHDFLEVIQLKLQDVKYSSWLSWNYNKNRNIISEANTTLAWEESEQTFLMEIRAGAKMILVHLYFDEFQPLCTRDRKANGLYMTSLITAYLCNISGFFSQFQILFSQIRP
jgi:hypothetical protein